MEVQAVTFDVGGTLIEPWPSVGRIYAEVAAEHGVHGFDPGTLDRQFAAAWRAKSNFDYSRAAWADLVAKTFSLPGQTSSQIHFFGDLYDRFAHREVWRIHDDVLPTLDRLCERGVQLAVISNWDERLRPLLKELELDRYFEFLAISNEIGFHKPSPVIFQETTRRLGVSPANTLHVGDSLREDVEGASQAGLRALLIDRQGRRNGIGELSSLSTLEVYLK